MAAAGKSRELIREVARIDKEAVSGQRTQKEKMRLWSLSRWDPWPLPWRAMRGNIPDRSKLPSVRDVMSMRLDRLAAVTTVPGAATGSI